MNIEKKVEQLLISCDIEYKANQFIMNLLFFGFGFGFAASMIFFNYSLAFSFLIGSAVFLGFELFVYAVLLLTSNKRIAMIEDVLPDFLALMSSNIRSGLTPDRALLLSSRKEFGPLAKEINRAAKKTIAGKPFTEAFMDMTTRIRSETFSKTVRLIVEGVKSGGNLAELLEQTALDIRRFKSIRKEVSATVLVYQLFVFAAVGFGAPLLYSVSTFLIEMVADVKNKISIGTDVSAQLPLFHGSTMIPSETIYFFSLGAIIITAFFGSLTAGVISKGKESEGIAYIPLLIFISLAIFFVGKFLLDNILSTFFFI